MVIVETPTFTRQVDRLLTPESFRQLQLVLSDDPRCAPVIRGSGGLRKIRWAGKGRSKRGGIRVIYYYAPTPDVLLLLLAYEKTEQDDLTLQQLRTLRQIVEAEFK